MLYQEDLAGAFADAIAAIDPAMAWICENSGPTAAFARQRGMKVMTEFTADRAYDAQGKLVITRFPEPVAPDFAVDQVRQVLETGTVLTNAGTPLPVKAEIVCMHSDTPNSAEVARALRAYLEGVS
jgi:UPF0271 protein